MSLLTPDDRHTEAERERQRTLVDLDGAMRDALDALASDDPNDEAGFWFLFGQVMGLGSRLYVLNAKVTEETTPRP